jgi:DNA-3-methyladenine glycosylase II
MTITPKMLRAAEAHLSQADKKLSRIIALHGPCDLAPKGERSPYEALVRAIAHQQLHGKAAETILDRFVGLYKGNFPTPKQILKTPYDDLRGVGFSNSKVLAIQDIAQKTLDGVVPTWDEAQQLDDATLIKRLVAIRGVGQWTVEMFLIFTLGRLDIFPVDDYGVKVGVQHLYKHTDLPHRKVMAELGQKWQPYRSVAAWYFWRVADSLKVKK